MFIGKILGGLIGFFTFGPVGAIVGLLVGHFFDKGRMEIKASFSPEKRAETESAFFVAIFPLMGCLAKADGRVSEQEISSVEQLFAKMQLDDVARKRAIALFQDGTKAEFSVDQTLDSFIAICGKYRDLKQIFLVYLISTAYADGELHKAEEAILFNVAKKLGYSSIAFNHLLGMVSAQAHFYRTGGSHYQGQQSSNAAAEIEMAYSALGVSSSASDAELKIAYRKLMSEYHPDKLAGRGVPEEMVKVATERAQEIQAAYDLIKKSRK